MDYKRGVEIKKLYISFYIQGVSSDNLRFNIHIVHSGNFIHTAS